MCKPLVRGLLINQHYTIWFFYIHYFLCKNALNFIEIKRIPFFLSVKSYKLL